MVANMRGDSPEKVAASILSCQGLRGLQVPLDLAAADSASDGGCFSEHRLHRPDLSCCLCKEASPAAGCSRFVSKLSWLCSLWRHLWRKLWSLWRHLWRKLWSPWRQLARAMFTRCCTPRDDLGVLRLQGPTISPVYTLEDSGAKSGAASTLNGSSGSWAAGHGFYCASICVPKSRLYSSIKELRAVRSSDCAASNSACCMHALQCSFKSCFAHC